MNLKPRIAGVGTVTATERGWLLTIPSGPAGDYRLAQLDDHRGLARVSYPCRSPLRLQLDARVSSVRLPGTWGFGLWNDPYGFSFGPGDGFLRLPALPNAAWFFYSSPISYLSFRNDKPGNGWLAQVFASPQFDPLLIRAALTFPFSRTKTRALLSGIISEDSVSIDGPRSSLDPSALSFDPTGWHHYTLEWTASHTRFTVDDKCVLDAVTSPRGPLGLVLWIDNQHAGFDPRGNVTFGLEANPEPSWLELADIDLQQQTK
jgi:hypothetical protein